MLKKFFLTTILLFFFYPAAAHAVGIAVKPSRLKTEALLGQLTFLALEVKNPSTNVSVYDVYLEEFSDWIQPTPSSFTLEAGETKKVELQIRPQSEKTFGTLISVVTKPLSARKFQASSGVKIPLEIAVTQPLKTRKALLEPTHLIYLLDIILGLTILISLVIKTSKKEKLYSIRINMLK